MLLCELDVMEYAVTMEEVEVDNDLFDYEVEDDDEQWGGPDDNPDWDDYDEMGYNPYMGCYDYDC